MKKFPLTVLLFFALITVLHGQHAGKFVAGVRFGLQVGMHEAQDDFKTWISHNGLKEETPPNPNLVLFGAYSFTKYIGLQTELNFMFAQGKTGRLDSDHRVAMKYSSLDIPVLLKINFLPNERRFGILIGPYFTTALGKVSTTYYNFTNPDEKNAIEAPHLGLTGGFFWETSPDNFQLSVDVRYLQDFGASKEKPDNQPDFGFMMRRGIAITLGIGYVF